MRFFHLGKKETFYIMYTLYILRDPFLESTSISDLTGVTFRDGLSRSFFICILLLGAYYFIALKRYSLKSMFFILGMLAVFFISAYLNHLTAMGFSLLMIFCSENVDFENIVSYHFKLTLAISLPIFYLGYTGLIKSKIGARSLLGTIRHSYGFGHYNMLALLIFLWIAEYLYLKRYSHSLKKYILPGIFTVFSFVSTYGFTSVAVSTLLIATSAIIDLFKFQKKLSAKDIKRLVVCVLSILFYLFHYMWRNPYKIAKHFATFQSRFILAQRYLRAYGINLWGHRIASGAWILLPGETSYQYNYLDNGYIRILIECGILVFVCFIMIYILSVRKMIYNQDVVLLTVTVCYLLYGFMEYPALLTSYNTFLLYFSAKAQNYIETKYDYHNQKIRNQNVKDVSLIAQPAQKSYKHRIHIR